MAVPTEGTANLSMRGIKDELENNNYAGSAVFSNISLKNMSDGTDVTINTGNAVDNRPDSDAPYAMSEFYDYDQDVAVLGAPNSLTHTANSVSTITFGYTEGNASTKTFVYLISNNGTTTYQNQIINVDGFSGTFPNKFQSVDGSGTSNFTIGGGSDTIQGSGTPQAITFGPNDFLTIRLRAQDAGGNDSDYTSNITGYTLTDEPKNLALTVAPTVTNGYGDGNDGAYTVSATWDAPTGGASSYRVTHGQNSTRTNGANTQDQVVSGTSVDLTGVNNAATYYVWIKSIGQNGDSSPDYITSNIVVAQTYYSPVIADQTLSGTVSGFISNTVVSNALSTTIQLKGSGNVTMNSTAPAHGTLQYSISNVGDPGAAGTSNSATGFITEGTQASVTIPSSGVIYVRFRFTTAGSAGSAQRTVTISHNNVNDTILVTGQSTSGGGGGDGGRP